MEHKYGSDNQSCKARAVHPVAIEGPRLVLREFAAADVEAVEKVTADPAVLEDMPFEHMDTAETGRFVAQLIDGAEDPQRFVYGLAITRRSDERLVGIAQLTIDSFAHRRAEIGYLVGTEYWGHGYGREAAAALSDFGFDHLGLARIWAVTTTTNTSSLRLLKTLGFAQEGQLRRHLLIRGAWHDAALFARIRSEETVLSALYGP